MSRHRFIKALDFDDELETFDGEASYEADELDGGGEVLKINVPWSIDVEQADDDDEDQLAEGTAKVKSVLGEGFLISDKEIQDSLWHYYYNVEKTVNYLLSQKSDSASKKQAIVKSKGYKLPCFNILVTESCVSRFSALDFFADCPWFNIPLNRRGEIHIEPLRPRGGLLGGAPKVSKLAALAAARKQKDQENPESKDTIISSTTLLDRLELSNPREVISRSHMVPCRVLEASQTSTFDESKEISRRYAGRKRKSPSPPPPSISQPEKVAAEPEITPPKIPSMLASPSTFAQTLLGYQMTYSRDIFLPDLSLYPSLGSGMTITESNPFAGPSPDDIVAKAQNSSKGMKAAKGLPKSTESKSKLSGVEAATSKLAIDDTSRVISKNLDVLSEFKKAAKKSAINFVVIGHVDAGKSTLMGRLLYDLKVVDERTMERYQKEASAIGKSSFALAWVLDQGTEERNRGVTIDIAMNTFETERTAFTILDAPGHRDFVPNMIAGASQADFAVLVIDATTGSFESGLRGETRQHALLARSMGILRLVIAINKLDTVTWSQDRYMEIQQQIYSFLTTAGFQAKNLTFVPCSGLTGDNVTHAMTALDASWYSGPTLIDALESSESINRALERPLRLQIADIFRSGIQNPLSIAGRIDAGSVQVGDRVIAVPSNHTAVIKGITVDDEPADWAVAGQNVILHLADIDAIHLKGGDMICAVQNPVQPVTSFTAKVLAFEFITPMPVDVHRGRLHSPGLVSGLEGLLNKATGVVTKKKPRLIKPGDVARIKVTLDVEGGVPLESGTRIVLRSEGQTVGAGLIE